MTTFYTADHEWVRAEGDVHVIGITEHAQQQLGDIVYVDLPEVGRTFAAGEMLGEIESTKSVGELIAPASGEIVAVNDAAVDDPTLVNQDAEGGGWLVHARLEALPELLDADAYQATIA